MRRGVRPGGLLFVFIALLARRRGARWLTGTVPEADFLAAIEAAGSVGEYVERGDGTGPIGSLQVRARRSP
ncbi:hypothetical protein ABUL39_10675 [Rhodothermus marinus]|uniref:hypothetical protein n=1 Tax=Rhodothermus marinus TaxID=29549 RepID=UPI0037C73450